MMAMAFSRTLRALEADSSQPATGALLLAAPFLGSWLIWFFRADLARYEVTDRARLEALSAGMLGIVAEFPPPAALGSIRSGQAARMRVHGFPWPRYGSLSATVVRVVSEVANRLSVDPDHRRDSLAHARQRLAGQSNSRYRTPLDAEEAVRRGLWSGGTWRRFRLEAGRLVENFERT